MLNTLHKRKETERFIYKYTLHICKEAHKGFLGEKQNGYKKRCCEC